LEFLIAGTRFAQECRPLVWLALERRVKEPIGCGPTVVVHGASSSTGRLAISSVAIIARRSQARAFVHSRLTVIGATPGPRYRRCQTTEESGSTICAFLDRARPSSAPVLPRRRKRIGGRSFSIRDINELNHSSVDSSWPTP
jgi:hypothetical protein